MRINSMNNNTYIVNNGEVKADNIIAMIMRETKRTRKDTYEGSIFIDLPDERRVQCDFAINTAKLRIEYTLLPSDMDEEQYGIVSNKIIEYFYCNSDLIFHIRLYKIIVRTLSETLQKFLLDNKYKIAVI